MGKRYRPCLFERACHILGVVMPIFTHGNYLIGGEMLARGGDAELGDYEKIIIVCAAYPAFCCCHFLPLTRLLSV
mgnify:CR=1 FL=1